MAKYAVILAGGKGTRFWPLSRENYPKQFLDLLGAPLINLTINRLKKVLPLENIYVLTTKELVELTLQITGLSEKNIVAEPQGKNTAPAIAFFTQYLLFQDPSAVVGFFPADHIIQPEAVFEAQMKYAFTEAETSTHILTFGITPTEPNVNYGYIECAQELGPGLYKALRFREKPDRMTAQYFLDKGNFYWNSGMFVFSANFMAQEFVSLSPKIGELARQAARAYYEGRVQEFQKIYSEFPSISIDYEIMQKSQNIAMLKAQFQWSDVGTYSALYPFLQKDASGNAGDKPEIAIDARQNIIFSKKPIKALVGVDNLIVVETEDALLVLPKNADHRVKEVVEQLKNQPEYQKFL